MSDFLRKTSLGIQQLVEFITTFTGNSGEAVKTNTQGFIDASLIPINAGLPDGVNIGWVLTWAGPAIGWIPARSPLSWQWEVYRDPVNNTARAERSNESTSIEAPFIAPIPCQAKFITTTRNNNTNDYNINFFINGALSFTLTHATGDPDQLIFTLPGLTMLKNDTLYVTTQRIGGGNAREVAVTMYMQELPNIELLTVP